MFSNVHLPELIFMRQNKTVVVQKNEIKELFRSGNFSICLDANHKVYTLSKDSIKIHLTDDEYISLVQFARTRGITRVQNTKPAALSKSSRSDHVGKYLKQKREEAKISQLSLANTLGMESPQFVSNWERGVSDPPLKYLKTICKIIKADANYAYELFELGIVSQIRKKLIRDFGISSPSSEI